MDEKTPIELSSQTAIALTEIVAVAGRFRLEILDTLGRPHMEGVGIGAAKALEGRFAISRTPDEFLCEAAQMIRDCVDRIAPNGKRVILLDADDSPKGSEAGTVAELPDVFAKIGDNAVLLIAAKMVVANLFLNTLSAEVFGAINIIGRRTSKDAFVRNRAPTQAMPDGTQVDPTPGIVKGIVGHLEKANEFVGKAEKKEDLALWVHLAHRWVHACRNRGARVINLVTLDEIQQSAKRKIRELQMGGAVTNTLCSSLLTEALSLAKEAEGIVQRLSSAA